MTLRSRIRLAKESDLDALFDLDAIARHETERRLLIASSVQAGHCWVAVETGDASRLLGYGVLNRSFFGQAFIPLVVVQDSTRGRGVGMAILSALVLQCQAAKLFTSTNMSNEPMRRLLARLGFVASGQIENLDDGDPELVFVKFLS